MATAIEEVEKWLKNYDRNKCTADMCFNNCIDHRASITGTPYGRYNLALDKLKDIQKIIGTGRGHLLKNGEPPPQAQAHEVHENKKKKKKKKKAKNKDKTKAKAKAKARSIPLLESTLPSISSLSLLHGANKLKPPEAKPVDVGVAIPDPESSQRHAPVVESGASVKSGASSYSLDVDSDSDSLTSELTERDEYLELAEKVHLTGMLSRNLATVSEEIQSAKQEFRDMSFSPELNLAELNHLMEFCFGIWTILAEYTLETQAQIWNEIFSAWDKGYFESEDQDGEAVFYTRKLPVWVYEKLSENNVFHPNYPNTSTTPKYDPKDFTDSTIEQYRDGIISLKLAVASIFFLGTGWSPEVEVRLDAVEEVRNELDETDLIAAVDNHSELPTNDQIADLKLFIPEPGIDEEEWDDDAEIKADYSPTVLWCTSKANTLLP